MTGHAHSFPLTDSIVHSPKAKTPSVHGTARGRARSTALRAIFARGSAGADPTTVGVSTIAADPGGEHSPTLARASEHGSARGDSRLLVVCAAAVWRLARCLSTGGRAASSGTALDVDAGAAKEATPWSTFFADLLPAVARPMVPEAPGAWRSSTSPLTVVGWDDFSYRMST